MTGIIILNYNGASDTVKCVGSIFAFNTAPVKLIIVDNGSTRVGETEKLDSYLSETFADKYQKVAEGDPVTTLAPVTFLASKTNSGYAGGNNKGLKLAFADDEIKDVIILNNDILFTSDIIPTLLEVRTQAVDPAILTPLLIDRRGNWELNCARTVPTNWDVIMPFLMFKKNKRQILSRRANRQMMLKQSPALVNERFFEIGLPSGSFMFLDKALFRELGGFDERTFLYFEENILCKKIHDKGCRNYCVPVVKATHIGAASTLSTPSQFLQKCSLESADYYISRFSDASWADKLVWKGVYLLWKLKFIVKKHAK